MQDVRLYSYMKACLLRKALGIIFIVSALITKKEG